MMRSRRLTGYTLLETLAVMSLLSLIMSIAGAWIIRTMQFDAAVRRQSNHHTILLRLGEQLRRDLRRGQSMAVTDDNQLIITLAADHSATYQILAAKIEYAQIAAESLRRRETFELMGNRTAIWDTSGMPTAVGLIVQRQSESGRSDVIDLHIRGSVDSARDLQPVQGVDR